MNVLLGCIADDYTGATDLGAMLRRAGLRVVLQFGVPSGPIDADGCDAVIVALKSRSIPAAEAIAQSLAALSALQATGAERFFFKYCSTFDSTDEGNIGPVAEALADELGAKRVLFCPAFPENGRTVYDGHLFVHGKPLHESGMENHPLNPMSDANLVRVLSKQCTSTVGVLPYAAVDEGMGPAESAADELTAAGVRFLIADATKTLHLFTVGFVVENDPLVTGGSAIAEHLLEAQFLRGVVKPDDLIRFDPPAGRSVVIAGSCSTATQRQVAAMAADSPSLRVDPVALASGEQSVETVLAWSAQQPTDKPILIHSTASPKLVAEAHTTLGREQACELLETTLAKVAAGLVERGVTRLVIAGGETSGAVLDELAIHTVRIGPLIDLGVPWVETLGEPRLALALKSGNFGSDDFFKQALSWLE